MFLVELVQQNLAATNWLHEGSNIDWLQSPMTLVTTVKDWWSCELVNKRI